MQETCGCRASPRRQCDVCYAEQRVYLACSCACLQRHLLTHDAPASASERAKRLLTRHNAQQPDSSASLAPHRARLMQMLAYSRMGDRLLVLGAGNAADLDLPLLAERFDEVQLVDLDGAALARVKARQPESVRARLVLRPGIDLSGLLGHLDDWGDAFPEPPFLSAIAATAVRRLVAELGRFDVVLSSCALSQLVLPFRHSWVAPTSTWRDLTAALSAIHLGTVAGCSTQRGLLAVDVQEQDGVVTPDPKVLLAQLRAPGLAALVASPRLSEPWKRRVGSFEQAVYAIEFDHPRG